jgi:hypothetical protein
LFELSNPAEVIRCRCADDHNLRIRSKAAILLGSDNSVTVPQFGTQIRESVALSPLTQLVGM